MSFGLGASSTGSQPLAGGPLHDPVTVTADAPTGTVSSGGPSVTASWTYSQPQGDPQEWYRVVVKDGGVEVHDTGWLLSAAGSHVFDWDALELDGEGAFTMDVYTRGPESIGTGDIGRYEDMATASFTMAFGAPDLTITVPTDQEIHQDPDQVTVTWTFSDPGHTQSAYRVRLLTSETSAELYSTGWVTSTNQTVVVPYVFADNTRVLVEVQMKNDQGMRSS